MSSECVVTRSVRDLAAVLDGIGGYAPGELWTAIPSPQSYMDSARSGAEGLRKRLRVGLLTSEPSGIPVDSRIVVAVEKAGRLLEGLGHEVTVSAPRALFEDQNQAPPYDRGSDYRRRIRVIEKLLGRHVREEDVEPFLWEMAGKTGETVDGHLAAETWQQEWSTRVTAWWEQDKHDVLLTPTVPVFPEPLADLVMPESDPVSFFDNHIRRHIAFTAPFNVTGQPALAVPFAHSGEAGPPASIQVVGPPHRDDLVLAVAAALEVAHPSTRRPPINATMDPLPTLEATW